MSDGMRIIGVVCPECGDDYEASILYYYRNLDHEVVGSHIRCKACHFSWAIDRWGEPLRGPDHGGQYA